MVLCGSFAFVYVFIQLHAPPLLVHWLTPHFPLSHGIYSKMCFSPRTVPLK